MDKKSDASFCITNETIHQKEVIHNNKKNSIKAYRKHYYYYYYKQILTKAWAMNYVIYLYTIRKRGTKQQCLSNTWRGHMHLLHNLTYLMLKTHVQHTISLIQSKILYLCQRNPFSFNNIHQTPRSRNQYINTFLQKAQLSPFLKS